MSHLRLSYVLSTLLEAVLVKKSIDKAYWLSRQLDGYIKYLMFDAGVAFCMTRMHAQWIHREDAQKLINTYSMHQGDGLHGHYRLSSDKLHRIFELFWAVYQIFRGHGGKLTYDVGMRGHFMIELLGLETDPFILEEMRRVRANFNIGSAELDTTLMVLRDSCHRLGFRLQIKKPDMYPYSASFSQSIIERYFSVVPYASEAAVDYGHDSDDPYYRMSESECPACKESTIIHVLDTTRCVSCGQFFANSEELS